MSKTLLLAALATSVLVPGSASAEPASSWALQANQVCTVYVAKAKKQFATPVTPAGLYKFAVDVKALESHELAALTAIPNRPPAGTHALAVLRGDIAEVDAAIKAWKRGDKASFVRILKAYLNDSRPKAAFAAAGATKCG
jgi:hypothetical protein